MSKRDDNVILQDIKEAINRIISYTLKMDYEEFRQDHKTQDAMIRNIEILGEATKLLSNETKSKYPDIPWKEIAGTRDRLIHDYFSVNIDIIWDIAKNEIQSLSLKLKDI